MPALNAARTSCRPMLIGDALYFWHKGRWSSDPRELDRLLTGIDVTLIRSERAELASTLSNLAPTGRLSDPRFVQFENCVLDVLSGRSSPSDPGLVVPNVIPHAWDPGARHDGVEDFLDSISCGEGDVRALVEEMLGACLSRARIPYIWVLAGMARCSGGDAANGKSTLCELARALVGAENSVELDVHDLGRSFMTCTLRDKLLAVSSDSSSAPVPPASLSVLKKIPTQDVIMADVKFSAPVRFRPYATVILAANRIPGFISDEGLKRRTRLIPMRAKFEEGLRDPLPELETPEAMSALLVHAVAGLRRLLDRGPTECPGGSEAVEALAVLSSPVAQWVDDANMDPKALHGRQASSVYSNYALWSEGSGTRALPKAEFERELSSLFPSLEVRKCRHAGGTPTRRWMNS